jgi:hypothetical protein
MSAWGKRNACLKLTSSAFAQRPTEVRGFPSSRRRASRHGVNGHGAAGPGEFAFRLDGGPTTMLGAAIRGHPYPGCRHGKLGPEVSPAPAADSLLAVAWSQLLVNRLEDNAGIADV